MALPQNDHLTRKHLRRFAQEQSPQAALLEQLLTGSVYTFKDDFDNGINPNFWLDDEDRGFTWDANSNHGEVEGHVGAVDDDYKRLISRQPLWSPRHRCTLLTSINLPDITSTKFEVGFASPVVYPLDVVAGEVLVKATPTAQTNAGNFAVLCLDTDHNTSCDVITSANGTVSLTASTHIPVLTQPGPFSLMISLYESGGVSAWINGSLVGQAQIAPSTISAVYGTGTTGTAHSYLQGSGFYLWFLIQNRAASIGRFMRIDYAQAWQERVALA